MPSQDQAVIPRPGALQTRRVRAWARARARARAWVCLRVRVRVHLCARGARLHELFA